MDIIYSYSLFKGITARLAQSVEHETLNLRVVGSSPTLGDYFLIFKSFKNFKNLEDSES